MKTRIIVDSTADVTAGIKGRLLVVPLTIHFGEEEYVDGVTIDHTRFYEMLIEREEIPTTSQASPYDFEKYYQYIREQGDEAVVLTVSGKLSGTYQSAVIAAEDYPEIHVVDSRTVAIGTGILAEYALQLLDQGLDAAAIAAELEAVRDRVQVVALMDTLEYLKKGGRLSKTAAFAGAMLNIKPVLCIRDGEIAMLGKARGSRQGNNLLVEEIRKAGGVDFEKPVLLGYTGLSDALLNKYVQDSAVLWAGHGEALRTATICSVIGTHAGPGAVAVAFFAPDATEK